MPIKSSKVGASSMTKEERKLRSHITHIVSRYSFLHGTLNVKERTCGKGNCRCARGEKHSSLYIVNRRDGELRQIFVPSYRETEVRQWVARYQEINKLLDDISDFYWAKIQNRED
jgi:hypothetical protein